ncbi:MAG: group 1 glycosyl transferase [Candidatus Dadabacteria bacterium CSP1-2]|nr:MAG: group 1 glycosyl transferase [Candidatus Dadabacteria bacterium CSP1-2]
MVHNRYRQPGGEDAVFAAETEILRKHGHEVVEYLDDNRRIDGLNPLVAAANTVWSYASREKLSQVLRETKPDVVHFHNTFLQISPAAYYACWKTAQPVVQTLHNYRLLCPVATFFRDGHVCEDCLDRTPPWPAVLHGCYHNSRMQTAVVAAMLVFHRLLKTWQNQVHVYIALTEFVRRKFIEGGLPEEKIVVKPNFVYSDPGIREGKGEYVLFVGRLSPEKGIKTLLWAWQYLQKIPLKIVGDGPLMDEIRAYVKMHTLEWVELIGRCNHEEVLELMKGARFLVFPSEWYEGFPVTIAETFACGVPVIASRLGAMAEIVDDGRTGLHFEPGNSEDLAAKVKWAWTHLDQMLQMGREARAEYEAKYTAERNYKMLINIYEKAIEQHKRR